MQSLAVVLAIGLKREPAIHGMDHSAAHQDTGCQHFIGQADLGEGVDATRGKGEIDRSPLLGLAHTRIGPFLIDDGRLPRPAEVAGQQRTRPGRRRRWPRVVRVLSLSIYLLEK